MNQETIARHDHASWHLDGVSRRDGEKWASAGEGVIAAWVADMDFPVAPVVREALHARIDTDLGYPAWFDESGGGPLGQIYANRTKSRFGYAPDPTFVRMFTDVNQAIQVATSFGTLPGDRIALHTPACPPFVDVFRKLGRDPRLIPMTRAAAGWDIGLDRLADEIRGRDGGPCRALLLVNPHNPTGRVLRRRELEAIGELVVEHDVLVISDEVHAELTFEGHEHVPFASISPEVAARTVTLTSGSKAFNLAGVRCAVAHVGFRAIREAIDAHRGLLFGQVSALGVTALQAAWTHGDGWLDSVKGVLAANRRRLEEGLPEGIRLCSPEATFVGWLDCTALELPGEPAEFFEAQARVKLFRGTDFGAEGRGFVRLNFATFPPVLEEMLRRMREAVRRR